MPDIDFPSTNTHGWSAPAYARPPVSRRTPIAHRIYGDQRWDLTVSTVIYGSSARFT